MERYAESDYGITYRLYVSLENEGDRVMAIYGDSLHVLSIISDQPFYQNRYGAGLSTGIRKNLLEVRRELKYDSWLTIGREDNYDNNMRTLGLNLETFESQGVSIRCDDCAWYCFPVDEQTKCNHNKRIFLMQLTTKGSISGSISILGRTASGENFQWKGLTFQTE